MHHSVVVRLRECPEVLEPPEVPEESALQAPLERPALIRLWQALLVLAVDHRAPLDLLAGLQGQQVQRLPSPDHRGRQDRHRPFQAPQDHPEGLEVLVRLRLFRDRSGLRGLLAIQALLDRPETTVRCLLFTVVFPCPRGTR